MKSSVVLIHAQSLAPAKPAEGAACNGCGLCCLAEPCPAGMLVSRRSGGPCRALRWEESEHRYRCGLVAAPAQTLHLGDGVVGRLLARLVSRLARRWISAGSGCDASFGVVGNVAPPTTVQGADAAGFGGSVDRGRSALPPTLTPPWAPPTPTPTPTRPSPPMVTPTPPPRPMGTVMPAPTDAQPATPSSAARPKGRRADTRGTATT